MIGNFRRQFSCCILLVFCALVGCSNNGSVIPTAAVSGTVTLDGKKLPSGVIRFVPIDGTQGKKTSILVANGRFDAKAEIGPPIGTHRIEIESRDTGGLEMDDERAIERLGNSGKRAIAVVTVPASYSKSSTLKENVRPNQSNEYAFALYSSSRR